MYETGRYSLRHLENRKIFRCNFQSLTLNWYYNIAVGTPPVYSIDEFLTHFRLVAVTERGAFLPLALVGTNY